MRHKGYQLYIDGLLMPIAPINYNIKIKGKNKVVSLLNGNDLNLLKGVSLTEIKVKIQLPSYNYPAVMNYMPQRVFLDKFESLKSDKKKLVFPFILLREFPNRDIEPIRFQMVTLEDYDLDETEKSGMDIFVNLTFKQYLPPPVVKMKEVIQQENEEVTQSVLVKEEIRPSDRKVPKTATMKENETLPEFTKRTTGSFKNTDKVAKKNGIVNYNRSQSAPILLET